MSVILPTTAEELLAKRQAILQEAQKVLQSEDFTADDLDKVEKMEAEAEALNGRASKLIKLNNSIAVPSPDAEQPKQNQQPTKFDNWRGFVGAVALAERTKGARVDPRLKPFDQVVGLDGKALSGEAGSTGGYMIPTVQMESLWSVAAPMAIIRPGATNIPMGSRMVTIPALDQSGTTAGDPHFFGGITVKWAEEGADATQGEPQFRDFNLVARELVGGVPVPNSLLSDAPALAGMLGSQRGFPGAIAWTEDYAFLRGNGVGKPIGILNSPATISPSSRTSSNDIKYDDLAAMEGLFMGDNPIWVASISTKATLLTMNGPSGNAAYLWGNAEAGMPATLLGHPIFFTDKLPALGTAGDIMLVDRSYYVIGTLEQGTSVETSPHVNFNTNKTYFRIIHRVDGQPWLNAAITLSDGTTQVSPFVKLVA